MKAILEFNLPEENEEHKLALNGSGHYCIIQDLYAHIRQQLKHNDDLTDEQISTFESFRQKMLELEEQYIK